MVEKGWGELENGNLQNRIARCGEKLQSWGNIVHQRFKQKFHDLRSQLYSLKLRRDSEGINRTRELQNQMEVLLAQQEDYWR